MKFFPLIRTVQGDIQPGELGPCYSHEHFYIGPCWATENHPEFLLADLEKSTLELRELFAAGVRAAVDSMPCSCGRDPLALLQLSRASGLHLLAPTGVHLAKYYPPSSWTHTASVEELTRLFVADIQQGIDAHDYEGPVIARTPVRAGLIKVAAPATWDERTGRIFAAAAAAHLATGAPILTHTEEGQLALEQARFFLKAGVNPQHVVMSHLDRNPDIRYHRDVLETGVTIEYDSHFRQRERTPNATAEFLRELLPEFPDQIVLGMDAARSSYWKSYGGGPGLSWLYSAFVTQLRNSGLSEELLHKVFVTTPQRVFSFCQPEDQS